MSNQSDNDNNNYITSTLGIDNITTSFLDDTNKLPLIISPKYDDTLSFLVKWLTANKLWIEEQMLTYGAVLIRGFAITTPFEFEQAMLAMNPTLCNDYRGTSPRSVYDNCKYVFSAADVPVTYPIGQHIEMAFLKSPPRQLYFGCLQESSSGGGETSLCDFRKVYNELDPELRQKFEDKGVIYNRTHPKVGARWTFDVGSMLSWRQMFGTSDKTEVESIAQKEGEAPVQWIGQKKDTFFQSWKDDATQLHPVTKENVWFNHAQVFHWSTFPAELWYAFTRIHDIRFLLRAIIIGFAAIIKYYLLGHRMALDIRFGDDTPITVSEMNDVRCVVHRNMVFSTWKRGDIMCIDNFSVSHGRQPTYDAGRKVLVGWANPYDKTSTLPSSPVRSNKSKVQLNATTDDLLRKSLRAILIDEEPNNPGCVEATPDTSPESTLSNDEAYALKEFVIKTAQGERHEDTGLHKRHFSCPAQVSTEYNTLKNIFI